MHFKMYKSGKNWMVAGLMTTAVLAGLTLGNVNTTEAHADANTPVAAASVKKQNVTQAQYDAQKATVAQNSQAVANQQTVVNSASQALANVQAGNSAVSAVYSASANVESANQAWSAASANYSDASAAWKSASDKLDAQAPNHYNLWNNGYSDAAVKASEKLKSDQALLDQDNSDKKVASAAVDSASAVLDVYKKAAHQAALNYNRVLADVDATAAQKEAARAASLAANAERESYRTNVYQKALDKQTGVNLAWLGHNDAVTRDKTAVANFATIQKNAEAYANVLALAKAKHAAWLAFQDAGTAVTKAKALLKAVRETNLVPINDGQKNWYDTQARNAQASLERHANDNPANVNTLESHLKYDQKKLAEAKDQLSQDQQALKDGNAKLADLNNQLANATDDVTKAGLNAQITSYESYVDGLYNSVNDDKSTVRRYEGSIASYQDQIATAKQDPAYKTWAANNAKWQKTVDDAATADANYKTYLNGLANVSELQQQLNDAQSKLNNLQKEYQDSLDALNNMVVNGATTSYTVNPSAVEVKAGGQLQGNPTGDVAASQATVSVVNGHVNAGAEGTTDGVTIVSSKWTDGYDAAQAQVAQAQAELKAANQASKVIYISATYKLSNGQKVVKEVPVTVLNNVTTNPDEGQPTDNNKSEGSFTGVKNGEHFVNGKKVSAAQYNAYVAAHKNAVKKSAAKAATKKLPQTGNNSAAVVALGALSGMLGLGLAAKKREF